VLDGGSDPPQRGGEAQFDIFGLSSIIGTAEAADLKFSLHIEGWGP